MKSSNPFVCIEFGADIDYAQTKKQHTKGVVTTIFTRDVQGWPDPTLISTAYVERFNLTLRMSVKRLTRQANSFSKSLPHLRATISLFVAHYNFCRIHRKVMVIPAMEAALMDHIWTVEELLLAAPEGLERAA